MSESRKRKKPSGANGAAPEQQELPEAGEAAPPTEATPEDAAEATPPTEATPEDAAGAAGPSPLGVVELGSTAKGCWKVLADGKRVKLSDADWRKELARVFSRQQAVP